MPDKKITQLTELTIPNPADMYPVIDDPAGTPITKKISGSNMLKTLADGWMIHDATWIYASASTFTVAGDLTAIFQKGTFLKWTQTTIKYGVVASSSYSAPNTTVTIIVNTDYTIANAAITAPYISYAANPQGWPGRFTFAPAFTNLTVTGTPLYTGKFSIYGNNLMFYVTINPNGGTSASTHGTTYINNLPVTVAIDSTNLSVSTGASIGGGWNSASTTRAYMPTWAASGSYIFIGGAVPF